MSVGDPFFVVQKEVNRAVKNCRKLQNHWLKILNEEFTTKHDDYDRISNELKNNLRSIEWDLEDLEDTIGIIKSNSFKFNISEEEINNRICFINNTRTCIAEIKEQLKDPQNQIKADRILKQTLLSNNPTATNLTPIIPYPKLHLENENSKHTYDQNSQRIDSFASMKPEQQQSLVPDHVNILKNPFEPVCLNMDNKAVLLEDVEASLDKNPRKIDFLFKRFPSLAQLTNDRKKWCAFGFLGSSIFIVFLLLVA